MHAHVLLAVGLDGLPRITAVVTVPVVELMTLDRTVLQYRIRIHRGYGDVSESGEFASVLHLSLDDTDRIVHPAIRILQPVMEVHETAAFGQTRHPIGHLLPYGLHHGLVGA